MEFSVKNIIEMEVFGEKVADIIEKNDVICLSGDLGAGKTTLVQFIAVGLGLEKGQYVTSPSFAIMHEYNCKLPLYHMDFYRLSCEDEIFDTGLEEYFYNEGVSLIEWSVRLGESLPEKRLDIHISGSGDNERIITCVAHGEEWSKRLSKIKV